jgi:hypothetical protein
MTLVIKLLIDAECRVILAFYPEYRYAECHYAYCRGASLVTSFLRSIYMYNYSSVRPIKSSLKFALMLLKQFLT